MSGKECIVRVVRRFGLWVGSAPLVGTWMLAQVDDPFKQFHKDDLGLCVVRDGSGDYWLYIEANDYPGRNFMDGPYEIVNIGNPGTKNWLGGAWSIMEKKPEEEKK